MDNLPERSRRHLNDLIRLSKTLAGNLPEDLSTIWSLLSAPVSDALHTIQVYHTAGYPCLTRWQAALVEKLNQDAGIETATGMPDDELVNTLKKVFSGDSGGKARNCLSALQSRLFAAIDHKIELDQSVQWIGVRDFLQEAEVAAGMVQTMLADNQELKPAEIGLLLPDGIVYSGALQDACRLGGIPLSGLPLDDRRRDLGREAIFNFLCCRQNPAPAMALAVCLCSPLMPWSREDGLLLAQAVMDGDNMLRPPPAASSDAQAMLALLRDVDNKQAVLIQALHNFVALMRSSDDLDGQVQQAKVAVEKVCRLLETAVEIDWIKLRRAVSPRFVTTAESPDFSLEGVTVWRESHEPWRPVRRLIVLGFVQGHYPTISRSNPVFSEDEIEAIRNCLGLPMSTPLEEMDQRRLRFMRQLSAVNDSVTFLISRIRCSKACFCLVSAYPLAKRSQRILKFCLMMQSGCWRLSSVHRDGRWNVFTSLLRQPRLHKSGERYWSD